MTRLDRMEAAVEAARLGYVSLKAAHEAPNDVCVRVCLEAFRTHMKECLDHLDGVKKNRPAVGGVE